MNLDFGPREVIKNQCVYMDLSLPDYAPYPSFDHIW